MLLAPPFPVCFPFHSLAPSFPVCFPSTPDATPTAPDLPRTFGLCTCAFCACTYSPESCPCPCICGSYACNFNGLRTLFRHLRRILAPYARASWRVRTQLCNIGCLSPRPYLRLPPLVIASDLLPLTSAEYNFRGVLLVISHVTPLSELPFTPGGLRDVS